MQTDNINSAWGARQAHQARNKGKQDFAAEMAKNGLSANSGGGVRSGGQLLSDDMSRALASYAPTGNTKK